MIVKDPIYLQLNDRLRDLIHDGTVTTGDRFLTERQVAERFGVSRATANKALSTLVAEGLLQFRKGVGTFVQGGGRLDYDLRLLVSFTEKARAAGKTPSTRVLRLDRVTAAEVPAEISAALGTAGGEPLWYLERLRLADDTPVILERRHLVARFCPDMDRVLAAESLYETLTHRFRLDVNGADETIRAVNVTGTDAELLGVEPGAAGLLVSAVGYLSGGTPLWQEHTLYRGDAYEFQNRLGPVTHLRPAAGTLR